MRTRILFTAILTAEAMTVCLARADTPISIPCPASSPCEAIQVLLHDNTHGSITITASVPKIEDLIRKAAQTYIDATIPSSLTKQISLLNIRYLNGRIILHKVTIGDRPPGAAHATPAGPVAVSLIDEYQKELDHWHPFPLFRGHWSNDGWPTIGRFTVYGDATFGVDAPAPMPEQHVVISFREDHASGTITQSAIAGPLSFSLGGKTSTFSFIVVDSSTAARYGLTTLSVSGVEVNSINSSQAIVTGVIGPAVRLRHP